MEIFGVESLTLGFVVGLSTSVAAGLMVTASLQVLMKDRIALFMLSFGGWSGHHGLVETYPVFAQGLFAEPRDATGKIV